MTEKYNVRALLAMARQAFLDIGYPNNLLQENYTFADMFVEEQPLRSVELAVFAQEPLSYRSSCFGIVVPQEIGPEAIKLYRALAAPQIFAFNQHDDSVYRWQVYAHKQPEFIEAIEPQNLYNAILRQKDEWHPDYIFRAKSVRFASTPVQLDFFDAGLLPELEDRVHKKLSKLINDAIASCEIVYKEHHNDALAYKALFRLLFRLISAKLLGDRQLDGQWLSNDVEAVISNVEHFYFQHKPPLPVLDDKIVQTVAWKHIRDAFSFRNLSAEALAYVYENTFVSPEKRKQYGIHATPPRIAEYIVQNLPIEELPTEDRRIFEPFCGHAPFLTAAMRKLRSLPFPDKEQRHNYLVRMLTGLEIDAFACEIALACLIETDYPNPNGWHIENTDAFSSNVLASYLAKANIILCNPPYESFTSDERKANSTIHAANKAVEAVQRILHHQPKMLGFVLPRAFVRGLSYREARKSIEELYDSVSLIELPDNAFNYSDVETVLVVAHGKRTTQPVQKLISVKKKDYEQFLYTGIPTSESGISSSRLIHHAIPNRLNISHLQNIWDVLAYLPTLGTITEIHRGIEYNIPLKANEQRLIANVPHKSFVKGLVRVKEGFEPYIVNGHKYLNIEPENMLYEAYKLAWDKPKVIVNAARLSIGPWKLCAVVDNQGLTCYQNFHGIWPTSNLPLEVIAAILNGPMANAFLGTHSGTWHNQIATINQIPVPNFTPMQIRRVQALVREYSALRTQWQNTPMHNPQIEAHCRGIIRQIEGEILKGYDLSLALERELAQYFAGIKRPGPVALTEVQLSPTKRFYDSIIKIVDVKNEGGKKVVEAALMNWNPHQVINLPLAQIPEEVQNTLQRDVLLLAQVNVGAKREEDLFFENIRLAPEVEQNGRYA